MSGSSRTPETPSESRSPEFIDLSDEESAYDDGPTLVVGNESFARFHIDSDDDNDEIDHNRHHTRSPSRHSTAPPSQPEAPAHKVESCNWAGTKLTRGMAVELQPGVAGNLRKDYGDFITITDIFHEFSKRGESLGFSVEGLRTRREMGIPDLNSRTNEVCLLLDICADDPRDCFEQGKVRVFVEDIIAVREMRFTSASFPSGSYRDFGSHQHLSKEQIRNKLHLTCRQVIITTYPNAKRKSKGTGVIEFVNTRIHVTEVMMDGTNVGEPLPTTSDRVHIMQPKPATYGLGFSGAGGDATGARDAGADVKFAVDENESALLTFAANHPDTDIFQADMTSGIPDGVRQYKRILILHLSPPCKFFSPANTRGGKNDERNAAAIYTVGHWLKGLRPTYLTMENTSGLYSMEKSEEYLYGLVRDIVSTGYNVRCAPRLQLKNYGLASSRQRFFIIAAKIGYPLPEFPKLTHGPGLQPFVTVEEAIANIPRDDELHFPTIREFHNPPLPYNEKLNMNMPCVTCNGKIQHPNGRRELSLREISLLVGFPKDYKFVGSRAQIREQIGNVLPPSFWKQVVAGIIKSQRDFEQGFIDARGKPVVRAADTIRSAARSQGSSSASTPQSRSRARSLSPDGRPSSARSRDSRRERLDDRPIPIRQMVDLTIGDRSPRPYSSSRTNSGGPEIIDLDD